MSHVTRTPLSRSKVKVTRPLWLAVLATQHGHTVMVTYLYALHNVYRVTACRPGRGISWRPPAYSFTIIGDTASAFVFTLAVCVP